LLDRQLGEDEHGNQIVPVVLDKNTATYSLHLSGVGSQFVIRDDDNRPVTLQVVGLLTGSVLQGKLLISESSFLKLFPENSGQRFFLIRVPAGSQDFDEVANVLETQLVDFGFSVVATRKRLREFLAVQNTYLTTFQSLGALGLLMGTFGLAVAQLRSVLERRGELALMRSAGFRRRRLARMVLSENVVLLVGGLAMGCLAALVATLPHWLLQQANIPWTTLAGLLVLIAIAGIAAGWLAARAAIRAPLLPALRGD